MLSEEGESLPAHMPIPVKRTEDCERRDLIMAKKIVEARGPYFEEFQQDTKESFVKERKELQKLEAEQKEIELEIAQQQHRKQRAENALNYRRKRSRSDKARNHRLIHKGIAVECVCKDTEFLTEAEFYQLAEEIFSEEPLKCKIADMVAERKKRRKRSSVS